MKFSRIGRCNYISENKEYVISKDYCGWHIFEKQPNSPVSYDGSYTYYLCAWVPTFKTYRDCLKYFNEVFNQK